MKYLKYLKYVLRHKWFVFLGCLKFGKGNTFFWPLLYEGIIHDWSKLRPSEFIPYAKHFYGNKGDINRGRDKSGYYRAGETDNYRFDYAWLLHQKRNKHHWQYWILSMGDGGFKMFNMPDLYLLEMAADWYGAGRAISGRTDIGSWYITNKDKMLLEDKTRKRLEIIINNFDNKCGGKS